MALRFQYEFEWDPIKARENVKKHRVAFERAATIFLDPNALSEFDEESVIEDRWITWAWIERAWCWWSVTRFVKRQSLEPEYV